MKFLVPVLLCLALLGGPRATAQSLEMAEYSPKTFDALVESGQVVLLHFHSDTCGPCKRQRIFLDDIRLLNPSFDSVIDFVHVDFDVNYNIAVARTHDVDRAGVILLQKDGQVIDRLTGTTDRAAIHALMEKAFLAY